MHQIFYNIVHCLCLEKIIEKRLKGGGIGFDRIKNNNIDKHQIRQYLEPEDLVALTVEAAAIAQVPLCGTDWIPGKTGNEI